MMMSDDEMELRDLVAQTLEVNGVLNKIRAELRANVFLAFEEQDALSETNIANKRLSDFLETKEGHQVFCLVWEFLQFFNLDFTLAVLEPESNCVNRKVPSSREDLKNEFDLLKCSASQPLLVEFINKHLNASSSSAKKNSSKIPRPVKSPPSKDGTSNPDKQSSISVEFDNEDDELLRELGMSPVSFNNVVKKDANFTIWSDNSAEQTQNKTASEHTRKKTPSPEHLPKKTQSPEHTPKRTPSPSHTPKKTPSPEHTPKKTPSPTHTPKKTPSPEHTPKKTTSPELGSSKGVPPLPSISNTSPLPALSTSARIGNAASSDWEELLRMEEKLSSLGFELPAEDSQDDVGDAKVGKAVRYSYEDDFLSLEQSIEGMDGEVKLSITEEIEGDLSLGSFNGSQTEDVLCTTDETVSTIAAAAFDFGEDAIKKDDAWGETTDFLKV